MSDVGLDLKQMEMALISNSLKITYSNSSQAAGHAALVAGRQQLGKAGGFGE